jgi:hypothetical protein
LPGEETFASCSLEPVILVGRVSMGRVRCQIALLLDPGNIVPVLRGYMDAGRIFPVPTTGRRNPLSGGPGLRWLTGARKKDPATLSTNRKNGGA